MTTFQTISPVDGRVYVERAYASDPEIADALERARAALAGWRSTPLPERRALCGAAVEAFVAMRPGIVEELAWQMGRPVRFGGGEVGGVEERALAMIELAPEALADVVPAETAGFERFVRREPLGVVLVIAPWNYPYLTAVNAIVPALLAGNVVILRAATQTPLCADRFAQAFAAAGLPEGVFQTLHPGHEATARLIASRAVDQVCFTGSVRGGAEIERAAAGRFLGVNLELGGKDPAYVRADADLDHAVENLADGAFFNSGQSCCGIERIYVHRDLFRPFVDGLVEVAANYRLDDPLDPETTLGPMVRSAAADAVRGQVEEAVRAGARALVDPGRFPREAPGSAYRAPQVLVDVDHAMAVMTEETFGPVVGVMPVASDDEAVSLMNDSRYGLTAAVWTRDLDAARAIGARLETGTVFMNRCDYLDPGLAWTGVKDSGRGAALSKVGFEHLTRPKSFHLRYGT
jgi:acyl-CoA reductase-like NAD-dependent aldehyde dehydrogenase